MEKNSFLIFNDLVYHIYESETLEELRNNFMRKLRMLIPHSYASLLLAETDPQSGEISLLSPLCCPESFADAEQTYLRYAEQDDLFWILHTKESTLVKESDLLDEKQRLDTPLYRACYQRFHIYDTMQYSIIYRQKLLGVFTLFRTKTEGVFSDQDLFCMRSLGLHLSLALSRILRGTPEERRLSPSILTEFQKKFQLTAREAELLELILAYKNNDEISDLLEIKENTIQKHMQNIFRKTKVSSKWELLRLLRSEACV